MRNPERMLMAAPTRLKRQHLALKEQRLARRICGVRSGASSERAQDCGIDGGAANPADAVRDSDLVVLATPVISILDLIDRLGPALPPKTLMTDLGSTKAIVDRTAKTFGRNAAQKFVAGHSMARKGKLWRGSC
jgi:prephenate dehydrogenase